MLNLVWLFSQPGYIGEVSTSLIFTALSSSLFPCFVLFLFTSLIIACFFASCGVSVTMIVFGFSILAMIFFLGQPSKVLA